MSYPASPTIGDYWTEGDGPRRRWTGDAWVVDPAGRWVGSDIRTTDQVLAITSPWTVGMSVAVDAGTYHVDSAMFFAADSPDTDVVAEIHPLSGTTADPTNVIAWHAPHTDAYPSQALLTQSGGPLSKAISAATAPPANAIQGQTAVKWFGSVTFTTSGVLAAQWAQKSASASNTTTLLKGSYLRLELI